MKNGSASTKIGNVLLVEALRNHPDARSMLLNAESAKRRALSVAGSDEDRLIAWIAGLPEARGFESTLRAATAVCAVLALIVLGLAFVSGLGAGVAALDSGGDGRVNLFRPFGVVALVPVVLFLVWLGLFIWAVCIRGKMVAGTIPPGWIGPVAAQLSAWMTRWSLRDEQPTALSKSAFFGVFDFVGRSRLSLWAGSAVSHAFWFVYVSAALAMMFFLLRFAEYEFAVGTTIGSEASFEGVLSALGWIPGMIGFPAPQAHALLDSSIQRVQEAEQRDAVGRFVLASIAIYVLLPRFIALLLCVWKARQLVMNATPDLGHPILQEAMMELRRVRNAGMPMDRRPADVLGSPSGTPLPTSLGAGGQVPLVGLELPPESPWVQRSNGDPEAVRWNIRTRDDAARTCQALEAIGPDLAFVVVVASMIRTPDRNAVELIQQLGAAARAPLLVVLTGAAAARDRAVDLARRKADWQAVADRAGASSVVTVNEDDISATGEQELRLALAEAGVT